MYIKNPYIFLLHPFGSNNPCAQQVISSLWLIAHFILLIQVGWSDGVVGAAQGSSNAADETFSMLGTRLQYNPVLLWDLWEGFFLAEDI
jgi:hypothetical protein